jgi:hypothetical protein
MMGPRSGSVTSRLLVQPWGPPLPRHGLPQPRRLRAQRGREQVIGCAEVLGAQDQAVDVAAAEPHGTVVGAVRRPCHRDGLVEPIRRQLSTTCALMQAGGAKRAPWPPWIVNEDSSVQVRGSLGVLIGRSSLVLGLPRSGVRVPGCVSAIGVVHLSAVATAGHAGDDGSCSAVGCRYRR